MFKYLVHFYLYSLCLLLSIQIHAMLPNEIFVKQQVFSITTTFEVECKEGKLGTVSRKLFALTPEYYLKNANDELIAKAKMRFWAWGAVFDVQDAQGSLLGTVEQRFSWFFPTFEIISPTNQKLAKAGLNFWGTRYTIKDSLDGHIIAILSRPFFRLKNDWTISIKDENAIHERNIHPDMFLVLIAFQADYEYWQNIKSRSVYEATSVQWSLDDNRHSAYHLIQTLRDELERYRSHLQAVEAQEEDRLLIETLIEDDPKYGWDEHCFYYTAYDLIDMLSSDQLTPAQKSALFIMLEQRIEQLYPLLSK